MFLINLKNYIHTFLNLINGAIWRLRLLTQALALFYRKMPFPDFSNLIPSALTSIICITMSLSFFIHSLPCAAAESVCRSFNGFIYDIRTLDPVEDADISLSCAGSAERYEAKSAGDGKFEIFDVPYGLYKISVSKAGYKTDSLKTNINKTYMRYDTSIESERDSENKAISPDDVSANTGRNGRPTAGAGAIKIDGETEFAPKNNLYGVTGLIELPDCLVTPEGHYRIGYGVMRSRRTKSIGGSYKESNYSVNFGYGLTENLEVSVFALQSFSSTQSAQFIPAQGSTPAAVLPPFFTDKAGFSIKYSNSARYRDGLKYPYAFVFTNTNDGTTEVSMPVSVPVGGDDIIIRPVYKSNLKALTCDLAYKKPLFNDHRRLSLMLELIGDDKYRYNTINGGLRAEFKNDSAVNFNLMTDQNTYRLTTGVSATMLFK